MKKIGFILITIAALSLIGALFSAGRDANTVGGRLVGALILGIIGILLIYKGIRKENTIQENGLNATHPNQVSAPQEKHPKNLKDAKGNESNQIKIRNKISAKELIKTENAPLQFVENPNTGKIFFTCGSKKGYISPAALENMEKGELDDFCFAEVSKDGKTYVPCLMLVNRSIPKRDSLIDENNDPNNSETDKKYIRKAIKKLEIKRHLYSLLMDFIKTEYGDITVTEDNKDDYNIFYIPLLNAKKCYEDNEHMISICKENGFDYHQILEEVSEQIIDHYTNNKSSDNSDLPF